MKIIIGSDHGGFKLKEELKNFLKKENFEFVDFGTHSEDPVDYPDIALLIAETVLKTPDSRGIIVDGIGSPSAICANKVKGIRAACCHDTFSAKNSRLHNDTNVLTLGGRVLSIGLASEIVKVWLKTPFEGDRHFRRLSKIEQIERKYMKEDIK